jgi:hypothetical protein
MPKASSCGSAIMLSSLEGRIVLLSDLRQASRGGDDDFVLRHVSRGFQTNEPLKILDIDL